MSELVWHGNKDDGSGKFTKAKKDGSVLEPDKTVDALSSSLTSGQKLEIELI
jgi:hypothetical protein